MAGGASGVGPAPEKQVDSLIAYNRGGGGSGPRTKRCESRVGAHG
ncbi:hypothetical protein NSU_4783 [Novosphingobium pentaromativorans US6-1]|uniref:Uncharacterized protein n=1 Tax=Novosphingobium pentaromativorans US6-1 TaxID=1088721 RepID=G6EKB3_9SPHN|nr:hypothetical protein NSU_4783 [Novosphingobium pentaromativorans US6-1]